jgi:hypothetical protein
VEVVAAEASSSEAVPPQMFAFKKCQPAMMMEATHEAATDMKSEATARGVEVYVRQAALYTFPMW